MILKKMFVDDFRAFSSHAFRVKQQFETFNKVRKNLLPSHVLAWKMKSTDSNSLKKKKYVMSLKKIFVDDFRAFSSHVFKVKQQFETFSKLRKNLLTSHVLAWMDYAENFTCSSVEQPQGAYWNSASVTLHPVVVYLPEGRQHKSLVAVSNELSHGPPTVYAIIKKFVPEIKNIYAELKHIHYLTDSPTSQYRNRTIFQIMTWHKKEFRIMCSWDYHEAAPNVTVTSL